ncbi:MAG: chromate transporter [Mesorhizobium amorphae]|nr:MAG: chromate transporter [Mesorhizobium amorphae]
MSQKTGKTALRREGGVKENGEAVPLAEAARVWARIACLSFGGPAGQIALMHRVLVEERRWIGEARFLHALNFCMLLPGPEAQQLATYVGWLMHGTRGALLAGVLFVLPGLFAIMALSFLYVLWGSAGPVEGLFFGLKAAVLAVVAQALVRIGGRALRGAMPVATALLAFFALFLFGVPFPLVILAAVLVGICRAGSVVGAEPDGQGLGGSGRPRGMATVALATLALWLGPVLLLWLLAGEASVFTQIGLFFAQMAVVTFGGAYAVLAYVAQQAVEHHGWLAPGEMLDGLGLAETTPGPLIMVTQFVGFLAAYRNPGPLDPHLAAVLGGLLTTWVTFAPSFLWIFLGAPFVERLRGNRMVAAALETVSAAVVGVIASLAVWFALHVLFGRVGETQWGPLALPVPEWTSLDWASLALAAVAALGLFVFRLGVVTVLLGTAGLGVVWSLVSL